MYIISDLSLLICFRKTAYKHLWKTLSHHSIVILNQSLRSTREGCPYIKFLSQSDR